MTNYPDYVISAVHQWFINNKNEYKSRDEIRKLSKTLVLELYLEWEGIYGYTHKIIEILTAENIY